MTDKVQKIKGWISMEQYISKDALVAEIKNLENTYKKCPTRNSYEEGLKDGRLIGYKDALYKIETLEVKECETKSGIVQKDLQIVLDDGTYIDLDPSMQLKPSFSVKGGEKVKVVIIKED